MRRLIAPTSLIFLMSLATAFADMVNIKVSSRRVYQGQVLKIQLVGKNQGKFKVFFSRPGI